MTTATTYLPIAYEKCVKCDARTTCLKVAAECETPVCNHTHGTTVVQSKRYTWLRAIKCAVCGITLWEEDSSD